MFIKIYIFVHFSFFLLLLISDVIPLWSKHILCIFSLFIFHFADLSSSSSNMLFRVSCKFFISGIVLFNSRFSIWFVFYNLYLLLIVSI